MVEYVGHMIEVFLSLIYGLEFKSLNVVVFCGRALPSLWSLSTCIDVIYRT